jgi:hypothetical protein
MAKEMNFCVSAIVHAAHRVIVEKSYGGKCSSDPSAIASLTLRLHQNVREIMNHIQCRTKDTEKDWEVQVLMPLIANFNNTEDLKISTADTEYITLLATVTILAYEILLLPEASRDNEFLTKTFTDYLCEPEIYRQLNKSLKAEHRRLRRAGANPRIQQAVEILRDFLPHGLVGTSAWKTKSLDRQNQVDIGDLHTATPRPQPDQKHSPSRPGDLLIQVFLKPGCSLPFDFVDWVGQSEDKLVVKTCVGLRMYVEKDVTVSRIQGMFDTVTVRSIETRQGALTATIIVPTGYSYRATEVESVSPGEGRSAPTIVKTKQAILGVYNSGYVVNRKSCRYSVIIQSAE